MRNSILFLVLMMPLTMIGQQSQGPGIETVIQTGHYAEVNWVVSSPDSRFIATASKDKTIKLWEAATGREIRTFVGSAAEITSVKFSTDGVYLVSLGLDYFASIWEVNTGRLIKKIGLDNENVLSAAFSPDGEYLVTGTRKHHAILWKTGSWDSLYAFVPEARDIYSQKNFDYPSARSVDFTSDGKYLLVGTNDRTAILFETGTGKELRKYKEDRSSCTTCAIYASLSPDDGRFVTVMADSVVVWDLWSGELLLKMEGRSGSYGPAFFSSNGKYITSTLYSRAYVWDAKNGRKILELDQKSRPATHASFMADGRSLLMASSNRTASVNHIEEGTEIITLRGYLNDMNDNILNDGYMYWVALVNEVVLSPDGRFMAVGKTGNNAKLLDFNTGRVIREFKGHEGIVVSLDFSPDGKHLVTGSIDGTARIWETETGEMVRMFPDFTRNIPIFSVKFSLDGNYIVTGGWDGYATIWDVQKGEWVKSLKGHDGSPYAVSFSHNGLYVVSAGLDRKLKIFEMDTGEEIRQFIGHTNVVASIKMLDDNRHMLTGSWDGMIKMWDLATGMQVRKFIGHEAEVHAINTDQGGRYLVSGSNDNTARLWDLQTGKHIRTFTGHAGAVSAVHIDPTGSILITGSRDGTIKSWDLESGNELLTHVFLGENDWLVKTRQGFFDASEGARKSIFFVKGTEIYSIDQFFEDFYRPGLLNEVYKNRGLVNEQRNLVNRLEESPPPQIEIISPEDSFSFQNSEVMMLVKVTNTGGGIDEVLLQQNGKSFPVDNQDVKRIRKKDQYVMKTLNVSLIPGFNNIEVSAFSEGRIESEKRMITLHYEGFERTADCYVLSIGINKYQNPSLDLNYARADARAFSKLVRDNASPLFRKVNIMELYDKDATRESIMGALDEISEKIRPEDVFCFYYAGHGSMVENRFYFIPTESISLYQPDKLKKESIDALEMQAKFKQIKALKQVVVLDACQSGGANTELLAQRGGLEEKALAQLSRSSGVHVLAAAGSEQYATEFGSLGHGVFTHVILEALAGGADGAPEDGKVTIYELKSYLNDQVPELSRRFKGQPQYPYTFSIGHDFPIVFR